MNFDRLRDKLQEIRDFLEALANQGVEIEKIKRVQQEIEQLLNILSARRDIDELLAAFRLMRMLIEKLKDLGDKVPMMTPFLELYIEALKTTEVFIEITLARYSFTGRICDMYYRYRRAREEQLRGEELDEASVEAQAHTFAWEQVDDFTDNKYEEDLKAQYAARRRLDLLREEQQRADEDAGEVSEDNDGDGNSGAAGPASGPVTRPSGEVIDYILMVLRRLMEIDRRLRDSPSEEERRRLEAERESLWRLLDYVVLGR